MGGANLVSSVHRQTLLRLNLEELLLCVNAALGGAPSAAAMAVASGWPNLVLPALLVGIWGYAVGTFIGLVVGELLIRGSTVMSGYWGDPERNREVLVRLPSAGDVDEVYFRTGDRVRALDDGSQGLREMLESEQ